MLSFFRKIRKKLLETSQTFKYIKYAIGEIILVVIGILIALQINNWNEKRKEKLVETNYLERLLSDIKKDTSILSEKIELSNNLSEDYLNYIKNMYVIQKTIREVSELTTSADFFSGKDNLILSDVAYSELLNSGKLDIISNEHLKTQIVTYYRNYTLVSTKEKGFNEQINQSVEVLIENTPISKYVFNASELFPNNNNMFRESDWEFLNKPSTKEFRNWEECIYTYYTKHRIIVPYYKELKNNAEALIISLKQSLL